MTDLEITRLCAEAMGIRHIVTPDKYVKGDAYILLLDDGEWGSGPYHPLDGDEQAMALLRELKLNIAYVGIRSDVIWACMDGSRVHEAFSGDLNRAICECVAKMQRAKK